MEKENLKSIIAENQEFIGDIELVNRNFSPEINGNYVFVGVRQAGKSYLLYQMVRTLIADGKQIHDIVYVNFDDERLINMTADDLDLILQAYYSMYDGKPVFLFDEIQNVDGWAHFARRLANQKYRVFITGSNAKMLSRDIATVLGGRYLDEIVYPFSFAEYLTAVGVELPTLWQYGRKADEIQRHFNTYFQWGGFPELIRFKEKRIWLNSLFNKIFFNDLIVRHKIKNETALHMCLRILAETIKQPCSLNRLSNLIKSTGTLCSPSTVMDYMRYLQEACIILSLDNYASKIVEKETIKKHYFVDNGLLHLFINNPESALLENLCAINLYKQYNRNAELPHLYYYHRNVEVDFFVPDEGLAIQASYSIQDENTRRREVSALVALNTVFPLKQALIITYDTETTIEEKNLRIDIIPVWKWLLDTHYQ